MKRSRARSPEAIEFARRQRATANEFANVIWQIIRNRQVCNQKFRREVPIPPYTADFCCIDLKLILEVDGAEHFTDAGKQRDQVRDDYLAKLGYRIMRIEGYEVLRDLNGVEKKIYAAVKERMRELEHDAAPNAPHPRPLSPLRGEGG